MDFFSYLCQFSSSRKSCKVLCFWFGNQQIYQEIYTCGDSNGWYKGDQVAAWNAAAEIVHATIDKKSRSSLEMTDPDSRPAMAAPAPDMARYDTVFVGFPIWWGVEPRVVDTFLESRDLTGKTVIPFATSGGSGMAYAQQHLQGLYPALRWEQGELVTARTAAGWAKAALGM